MATGRAKKGWGQKQGAGSAEGGGVTPPKMWGESKGFWLTHKRPIRAVSERPVARTAGGQTLAEGN